MASSAAFLALAFLPFLAPVFGRLVVPWMAYRALWGVPFGLLLGALVLAVDAAARRYGAVPARSLTAAAVLALAALAAVELPWSRAFADGNSGKRTAVSADTRSLLRALAALPDSALIAVAPGLAELVPAYTGRPVLAFTDRGTVALAGSRDVAEQRLVANAAIVGLRGTSDELRARLIARYEVTHVVYENSACDLGMATVYAASGFRDLCSAAAPAGSLERRRGRHGHGHDRASAHHDGDADPRAVLASLPDGIDCEPAPVQTKGLFHWQRRERWAAAFTAATCRVRFSPPRPVGALRVRAHLPHAREALVFDAAASGPEGTCTRRSGVVELGDGSARTIDLECAKTSEVTIRLVPSFLPYLNLRELEVVGDEPAAQ
jgi:hypothetical protein